MPPVRIQNRSAFEVGYLAGNEAQEEDAQWVINRMTEQGMKELPEIFLERHREAIPVYLGSRTKVFETEKYENVVEAVEGLLKQIEKEKFAL